MSPPASWLAKQAEHCARATPECFEDDPGVIRIFLNGKRTVFGGVEKLRPEVLVWGNNVQQPVNDCLDTVPPRLTDADVGVTQEQWARCARRSAVLRRAVRAAALRACARVPCRAAACRSRAAPRPAASSPT